MIESIQEKIHTLLRKSERVFKTDMVYLATGGSWLGISQIITSGSAFLVSLIFANLLLPETYGMYKYIISIVSLLLIPTLGGVDSAVTSSVARGFDGTLLLGVKTKIRWGTLGSLGACGVALYYYLGGNTTLTYAFLICALFIPFIESFDLYNAFLNGKKLFRVYSQWNSSKKIIAALTLALTVFFTHNILIILGVYFSSTLFLNIFFLDKTHRKFYDNETVDPHAMTFGKHLSFLLIFTTVLGELDKILVFHYLGAPALAVYTLAGAPVDQIKGILKNINSLAFPKFATQEASSIKKTIGGKIVLLTILVSLIVLGYSVFAPLFFHLFFPKYLASIHYSQVIAFTVIGAVVSGFMYTILEAHKHTKALSIYNISTNLIELVLFIPLIYYFGIWGAIISTGITRFSAVGISYWLVQKM